MKFTALRHAISVFNETGTSDKNCGLSESGKKQASKLSGQYDVAVCSMMKRCRETLYESGIFADQVFNVWDCREWKKDICDFVEGEDETVHETEEELMARVEAFKAYLRGIHRGRSILLVSHGDFLNRLSGKTVEFKNAQMSELEILDDISVAVPVEEAPIVVEQAVPVEEAPIVVEQAPIEVVEEAPVVVEEAAVVEEAPVVPVEEVPVVEEAPVVPVVVEAPTEQAIPVESVVIEQAIPVEPVEEVVEAPTE